MATDPNTLEFDFATPWVRRHVLSWQEPLPRLASTWLAQGWDRAGPLDLSASLVIVPTRQSGRRLREALASLAAEAGQAVFPPRVILPETLATLAPSAVPVATRAQQQLAWIGVLRSVDLHAYHAVFPVEPAARSFTWARELASQLMRLQATLGEAGLEIGTVLSRLSGDNREFPELERWEQLGRLASLAAGRLRARDLVDPASVARAAVAGATLPPGITRIVLLATPDPLPLAVEILARHAERVSVDVLVYGANGESPEVRFDEWGRPRPEVWSQLHLGWTDFEQRVHLCADGEAQAALIVGLAKQLPPVEGHLGIGVADAEVLAPLEHALSRAGIPAYNPAGQAWRGEGFHALLLALADFARNPSWDATTALLRCPDLLLWLAAGESSEFSVTQLLRQVDALGESHLPPTLSVALEQTRTHPEKMHLARLGLDKLSTLRACLIAGDFPANAVAALQLVFSGRRLETGSRVFEAVEVWTETLREASEALAGFSEVRVSLGDAWEFALALYGERTRFADKPLGAVELNGWLELLWEDAPHLVVAGLNDGRVPEAVVGDAFLPEALRSRIGLKTNAMRFARDAYILHALAASRSGDRGRLDVLVGKVSVTGDPLRPSRLLLRCPDEELPRRVEWLFREVEAAQASLPWTRAWTLRPRVVPPPSRVSVTGLRDWLQCPFRFYLKHALKMRRVEPEKAELDARDFGTLLHASLQRLAEPDSLACTDLPQLRDFLLRHFEQAARERYGDLLTLPLLVQFESARQRLRKAAEVELRERELGWRIERVEWKFEIQLGGMTVSGMIDRVDRHRDDPSRIRVIDYKTADTPSTARAAHLRAWRAGDERRDAWQRIRVGAKDRLWVDLQLPLYRRAVAAEFGTAVECGYFNLPKAVGETALVVWDDLTPDVQAAAERCAIGITTAISEGRFWPPAELDEDTDDWAELFHQGAAESVAPEIAAQLTGKGERSVP